MGDYRFCIKVKNVEITPINPNEIELDVKIDDKRFDDILMEIPEKEIIEHLANHDLLTVELFLKYHSLEEVFDKFNHAELKTRLAQHMIDTE
jgi:hypothetical protein